MVLNDLVTEKQEEGALCFRCFPVTTEPTSLIVKASLKVLKEENLQGVSGSAHL